MSWHRYAASLALIAAVALLAALGEAFTEVALAILALGVALQARALWRLYRDG